MNPTLDKLLHCLADGQYHSGEELGDVAGVSRAAIWKQIKLLQEWGLSVESQKSRGYRISGGLTLLNEAAIRAALTSASSKLCARLDVCGQIDSTNATLLRAISEGENARGRVCFAEQQSAGRGRRGRYWQSPFAANIYMSLAWKYEQGIAALEGLSLATGVSICRSLERIGVCGVQLKWPNDLLHSGKKLGGVLLEIAGDVSGDCSVVVGIGLNVRMPEAQGNNIDQAWTDIRRVSGKTINRNQLAAELLNDLLPMLATYSEQGFGAYRDAWQSLNAHQGAEVCLVSGNRAERGRVCGVDASGGLVLQVGERQKTFLGGEISLRVAE